MNDQGEGPKPSIEETKNIETKKSPPTPEEMEWLIKRGQNAGENLTEEDRRTKRAPDGGLNLANLKFGNPEDFRKEPTSPAPPPEKPHKK